jgi:pimeloyl-ACP methyl ester carboxylesterase
MRSRKLIRRGSAVLFGIFVLAGCQRGADTTDSPTDPRHDRPRVSFVEVSPGVSLEVIEWSTHGPPLVLLAGATHSAHVYEDFAPHLADQFRVIGITRRRIGASSAPDAPFGIDELSQDVMTVLDSFGIDSALFVGHSFGGAELSHLIQRWPKRVRKAVYLDGAWDFYDMYNADGWFDVDWPDVPMRESDTTSPQAVSAFFARTQGFVFPLNEILAVHEFNSDGRLLKLDPNVGTMFRDMIRPTLRPIDYSRLVIPLFVVRAIPATVKDLFRGYHQLDAENQQRAETAFEKWVRVVVVSADRFVEAVQDAQVMVIEGGSHEILQVHAAEVLAPVRAFLLE